MQWIVGKQPALAVLLARELTLELNEKLLDLDNELLATLEELLGAIQLAA